MMRLVGVVGAVGAVVLLAATGSACTGGKVRTDAAVARFCSDTAGLGEILDPASAGGPGGITRLASFQATLSVDVNLLQSHGDSAVAAEAQVVQSLVSSLLVGAEAGAAPSAEMAQAAATVRQIRDQTC